MVTDRSNGDTEEHWNLFSKNQSGSLPSPLGNKLRTENLVRLVNCLHGNLLYSLFAPVRDGSPQDRLHYRFRSCITCERSHHKEAAFFNVFEIDMVNIRC